MKMIMPEKCDKDWEIGQYLKGYKCIENHFKYLIVTFDKIQDALESPSIFSMDRTNYWIIVFVLLAIACLLLPVVIVLKCYMKHDQQFHACYHISVDTSGVKEIYIKNRTQNSFCDMVSIKSFNCNDIKID